MSSNTEWDALAQTLYFPDERTMLETLYETHSILDIARMLKCGPATVQRHLQNFGIQKRQRGGAKNSSYQRYRLFHMDQRIIVAYGTMAVARLMNVAPGTLYKYKLWKRGGTRFSSFIREREGQSQ